MNFHRRCIVAKTLLAIACLGTFAVRASAQQPQRPGDLSDAGREALNAGIAAFKAARYEDAVASFRTATQSDPDSQNAHLYLGAAYSSQVVPNLLTPENKEIATSALAEFDVVLKLHPGDLSAMKQEAATYRNMQQYDQAMDLEKRIATVEPNDAEAFYIMGSIDWTRAYKNAVQALAADGLTDDGVGNAKMTRGACENMRAQNAALVEDGIANLARAIDLKPDYDDAMQYLQLTYRRHADFACGDLTAIGADLKLADQLTRKAIEIRKQTEALRQK